jgi:hypothetical protein
MSGASGQRDTSLLVSARRAISTTRRLPAIDPARTTRAVTVDTMVVSPGADTDEPLSSLAEYLPKLDER